MDQTNFVMGDSPQLSLDEVIISGVSSSLESNPLKLSKDELKRFVLINSDRISFKEKDGGRTKSDVWKLFQLIEFDGIQLEFVKCRNCDSIYSWNNKIGTSTIKKHSCGDVARKFAKKAPPNNQASILDFAKKSVPETAVTKLNDSITMGLAQDLRPLYAVEGEGFLKIAQSFVDFGAAYGRQDIRQFIRHRTTLKNKHLPSLVGSIETSIKELLTTSSCSRLAFTTDMWSDRFKQRKFLSLHVHLITNDWKLKSIMLGVEEFEKDATTINIRDFICKMINKYVPDEEMESIIEKSCIVTDGASNLANVLPNRYDCFCHRLNLIVHWTLNVAEIPPAATVEKRAQKGNPIEQKKMFNLQTHCPKTKDVLKYLKKLVQHFKKSGLNKQLKITLKQDVETRWNSQLEMLESYAKSVEEVKKILHEKDKLEKISKISDDVVKRLIEFLKPFEECTSALSGEKYPTFPMIALWHHKLKKHLIRKEGDSKEVEKLREQARICFEEYFAISDLHYVGCMLDPRYRSLKFASSNSKQDAIKLLRTMCEEFALLDSKKTDSQPTSTEEPVAKKAKKSLFSEFVDSDDDEEQIELDEVDKYLNMSFKKDDYDEEAFNALDYWKNCDTYPKIKAVAKWILAIPASQTSDERTFSTTGQTITPRRTELNGSTLSMLTLLHANKKIVVS